MRKLEIGSGNNPKPGYEHFDIDPNLPEIDHVGDASDLSMFEDNTFDEIISIHCIEHIPWPRVEQALGHWFRVLKPGGQIYIATPDFEYIVRQFRGEGDGHDKEFTLAGWHFPEQCYEDVMYWVNFKIFSGQSNGDEHRAMFTFRFLRKLIEKIGFEYIRENAGTRSIEMWAKKP